MKNKLYAYKLIKEDEGLRLKPYLDTVGKTTIGYGRNLTDKPLSLHEARLIPQITSITQDQADVLFLRDFNDALDDSKALVLNFSALSQERQAVLVNMAFNLGRTRLRRFVKMLDAIQAGNFNEATKEMLDSKWARQLPNRVRRLAILMLGATCQLNTS